MIDFGFRLDYDAEKPTTPWRLTLELSSGTRERLWFATKHECEQVADVLDEQYKRFLATAEWKVLRSWKRFVRYGLGAWARPGEAV